MESFFITDVCKSRGHKYLKREGAPGHYKYTYHLPARDGSLRQQLLELYANGAVTNEEIDSYESTLNEMNEAQITSEAIDAGILANRKATQRGPGPKRQVNVAQRLEQLEWPDSDSGAARVQRKPDGSFEAQYRSTSPEYFRPDRDVEDDDHPEFVGRNKIIKKVLEQVGSDFDVDVWSSEKNFFHVSVTPKIKKAENLMQIRAGGSGPGSRGGHVIGHTKSGKPIYEHASHPQHRGFEHHEHNEASKMHDLKGRMFEQSEEHGEREGYPEERMAELKKQKEHHYAQAKAHGDYAKQKKDQGVAIAHFKTHGEQSDVYRSFGEVYEVIEKALGGPGSRGGKIIGQTKSGKPIYSASGNAGHKGFSKEDHQDAAWHHARERDKAWEEHRQQHNGDGTYSKTHAKRMAQLNKVMEHHSYHAGVHSDRANPKSRAPDQRDFDRADRKNDPQHRSSAAWGRIGKSEIKMPKKEFVKEHKKLVKVLRSPSHKDDLVEAEDQAKELKEITGKSESFYITERKS